MTVTTAVLGGEDRNPRRGMASPPIRLTVMVTLLVTLSWWLSWPGALLALAVSGVLYLLTLAHAGNTSAADDMAGHRRFKYMARRGFNDYAPVDLRPVNCPRRVPEHNRYRDHPDGIDWWDWLSDRTPDATAICYHQPPGGQRYFSVTFRVDGPLIGLAADVELEAAQTGFGNLLAGWGSRQKLVTGIQVTTRMLPPRTDLHEAWMTAQLDPTTPAEETADYSRLLRKLSDGGYVQRHYVTIRWDKTPRFNAVAEAHGTGPESWRALIHAELVAVRERLAAAGYTRVEVLTGPKLAAVIRHQQNPDFYIDHTADVTAAGMYRMSHQEEEHLITDGRWVHRTAQFPVSGIETSPRTGLWLHPLLLGMETKILHTVSIHITLVPASDAKWAAQRDVTADQAQLITAREKGRMASDETEVAVTAAQQRLADMRPGSGHHGIQWAGFVTFTVPAGENLALTTSAVEEAADGCGISHLAWCDTWQAAAQSTTWPMARALGAPPASRASKLMERLSLLTKRRRSK